MKRFILFSAIVVIIQLIITYFISLKVDIRFLDLMFYLGVGFMVITLFFSSSGGFISNLSDSKVMTSVEGMFGGIKLRREFGSVSFNPLVIGSISFFLLGIILATFFY